MSGAGRGEGEVERALLDGARLGPDEDVLVLAAGQLVFEAHERVGSGWVYAVQAHAAELEELFAEAHAAGASGVAYLVGAAPVLPLPDGSVAAVVGRLATDEGALEPAAHELARVLQAGGRLALAEPDAQGAEALGRALAAAAFAILEPQAVGGEVVVTARRG